MFGKSTKLIVAKTISVGKKAISSAERRETFTFPVIILASLYVKIKFATDNKNGITIVANSLIPKILYEKAVIARNVIRNGKIG